MELTTIALTKMMDNKKFGGFGYLGHTDRTQHTDALLINAANFVGASEDEVFEWANSRYARHFTDRWADSSEFGERVAGELLETMHEMRMV